MAASISRSVFSFLAQNTAIDLRADYIRNNYNIAFGVAVLIVTALFLCACIMGAVRGDPHVFVRALASTGTAILGSFVALTLLQMMLTASDGIAQAFSGGEDIGTNLVAQLEALPDAPDSNFALELVLSLLIAMFSFALFVVLCIRKIAIVAMAVFIPIYLAGQPTISTSGWVKRAAELLLAMIFAKPVIYAIFVLGAGMASESTSPNQGITSMILTLLSGVVVMIAAVFAPFVLLHLIGFADVHLMRAVGAGGRRGAASFGQGAGAMLGSSSRETFRGIGARLQTRNRGVLGDAGGGGMPIGAGAGTALPRPAALRTGRGGVGAPTGTASRTGTAAVRGSSGRPSATRSGGTAGAARQPARNPTPTRATVAVGSGSRPVGATRTTRVGGGAAGGQRGTTGSSSTGRPPVNPPASRPPRVTPALPPSRTGGK